MPSPAGGQHHLIVQLAEERAEVNRPSQGGGLLTTPQVTIKVSKQKVTKGEVSHRGHRPGRVDKVLVTCLHCMTVCVCWVHTLSVDM